MVMSFSVMGVVIGISPCQASLVVNPENVVHATNDKTSIAILPAKRLTLAKHYFRLLRSWERQMPITGTGWEFHVERLGIHKLGAQTRTYGAYQAFLDGQPIAA